MITQSKICKQLFNHYATPTQPIIFKQKQFNQYVTPTQR